MVRHQLNLMSYKCQWFTKAAIIGFQAALFKSTEYDTRHNPSGPKEENGHPGLRYNG
jgi:hypothetical protein